MNAVVLYCAQYMTVHLYTDCVCKYHKVYIAYLCLLLVYAISLSGTSPQFTAQPSDIVVAASTSTAVNCRATGTPQPTIQWYKDNVGVVLDGTHTVNSTGSLHISMVSGTDAGTYHCVASNTDGSVRSFSATLQIACKWLNNVSCQKHIKQKQPVVIGLGIVTQVFCNSVIKITLLL